MRRSSRGTASGRWRAAALLCSWLVLAVGAAGAGMVEQALAAEAAGGAGVPSESGAGARVRRIAEKLRCPVCEGLSVWASDSEAAWDMKQEIAQLVAGAQSDGEILDWYVARYGAWILMAPPARGFYVIVWLMPMVALGAGAGWLWAWRRARARRPLAQPPTQPAGLPSEARDAVDRRLEEYL